MDSEKIGFFADELFNAEHLRVPVAPFSERETGLDVAEAYAVQMENVRRVCAAGHRISGKKIGLTSPGIQRQLGVNEPDYGHLFDAMDCGSGRVRADELIQPKIEAELAFILKKPLRGGAVTPRDVEDATDYVAAAFEIVDSRVADWRIKLADTVADNASSGRYILGQTRLAPKSVDLSAIEMKLYKKTDGENRAFGAAGWELAGEGAGAAVLGDPRLAVAWLANRLWAYGTALEAGEIVLSGAFSAAPEAKKGDMFRAEFNVAGAVEAIFI